MGRGVAGDTPPVTGVADYRQIGSKKRCVLLLPPIQTRTLTTSSESKKRCHLVDFTGFFVVLASLGAHPTCRVSPDVRNEQRVGINDALYIRIMSHRFPNPWLRFAVWVVILVVPGGMILLGMLAAEKLRRGRKPHSVKVNAVDVNAASALCGTVDQPLPASGVADSAAFASWT